MTVFIYYSKNIPNILKKHLFKKIFFIYNNLSEREPHEIPVPIYDYSGIRLSGRIVRIFYPTAHRRQYLRVIIVIYCSVVAHHKIGMGRKCGRLVSWRHGVILYRTGRRSN